MSTAILSIYSHIHKPLSDGDFNPVMQEGTGDAVEIVSENNKAASLNMEADKIKGFDVSFHKEMSMRPGELSEPPKSSFDDVIEHRGTKRLNDDELDTDKKKCRTVIINSDDEAHDSDDSDSDSDNSDSDNSDDSDDSGSEINVAVR